MVDLYWDNVVLALPMDGIDGATNFTDLKGKSVAQGGNAKISTAQSKFGGASAYFDGAGDYLTVPSSPDFAFGVGDFCIECWVSTSTHTNAGITNDWVIFGSFNFNPDMFFFLENVTNKPAFWDGTTAIVSSISVNPDQWTHIACSRQSGVIRLFVGGIVGLTANSSVNFGSSAVSYIGGNGSYDRFYSGYIDDLRITKGIARYTEDFTPPSVSYFPGGNGSISTPIELVDTHGIVPIVGLADITSHIDSVSGDDGAIVANGEVYSVLDIVASSGTSEATVDVNRAVIFQKLEVIDGAGSTSLLGFGSVKPKVDRLSCSGLSGEWVGNGLVSPKIESVSAGGISQIVGRAGVGGSKVHFLAGEGKASIVGIAGIVGRNSVVASLGYPCPVGRGILQSKIWSVSSTGSSAIKGVGAISTPSERILARRHDKVVAQSIIFRREALVSGTTPPPPIEPINFTR